MHLIKSQLSSVENFRTSSIRTGTGQSRIQKIMNDKCKMCYFVPRFVGQLQQRPFLHYFNLHSSIVEYKFPFQKGLLILLKRIGSVYSSRVEKQTNRLPLPGPGWSRQECLICKELKQAESFLVKPLYMLPEERKSELQKQTHLFCD